MEVDVTSSADEAADAGAADLCSSIMCVSDVLREWCAAVAGSSDEEDEANAAGEAAGIENGFG